MSKPFTRSKFLTILLNISPKTIRSRWVGSILVYFAQVCQLIQYNFWLINLKNGPSSSRENPLNQRSFISMQQKFELYLNQLVFIVMCQLIIQNILIFHKFILILILICFCRQPQTLQISSPLLMNCFQFLDIYVNGVMSIGQKAVRGSINTVNLFNAYRYGGTSPLFCKCKCENVLQKFKFKEFDQILNKINLQRNNLLFKL
ncbi:hypothetical protein FGO68_gene12056 [Halteria grandinella]|uniref:Transmembrane protein n=1 Tax=Halteria grandinella TaxID=5974 RepID=A0A8J8NGF7_HALGN|nr:hypothetical protein FGO68_gene12056 [Halteria grandinella]